MGLVFLGPKVQAPDPCLEGAGISSDDTPVVCGRALSHAVLWLSIPISVRPKPEAQVKNPKPKTPQTLSTKPQKTKQKSALNRKPPKSEAHGEGAAGVLPGGSVGEGWGADGKLKGFGVGA